MPARCPSETAESARRVGSWRGGPGRCRLARALVRAVARRSHPASLLDRRSVPLLFGHALAVTAAHGPADQPSRRQHRRCGPAVEPSRGGRSRAVALIVRSEEHTSELQSPCISYAVFCLNKKTIVLPTRRRFYHTHNLKRSCVKP